MLSATSLSGLIGVARRASVLSVQPASVWRLDETSGVIAFDAMGVANGTHQSTNPANGVTIDQAGEIGRAVLYASAKASSYTSMGQVYANYDRGFAFSVCGWVKVPVSGGGPSYVLIGKRETDNTRRRGWLLRIGNGSNANLLFQMINDWAGGSGPAWSIDSTGINLFTNTWRHVCATYNGDLFGGATAIKLYVDGVPTGQIASIANLNATIANTGDLMIARVGTAASPAAFVPFDGLADDVAVFSGKLTDADVLAIYNGGVAGTSVADL